MDFVCEQAALGTGIITLVDLRCVFVIGYVLKVAIDNIAGPRGGVATFGRTVEIIWVKSAMCPGVHASTHGPVHMSVAAALNVNVTR